MRSRIIGSKGAEGKILIFLDSHVEVLQGWYSTVVARVMEDRKTVSHASSGRTEYFVILIL